ncbi:MULTISPECIES: SagB/ThcOx family dehydrogenase [unclassified Streptomyces]|uniref:SagB/ThcOx family dehydrogenase n=1 Tax=unclassified Streptomyces TaxID=2593676 RepID=UPI002E2FBD82|nr:SagB/ThcOx family dehydrogenase [Streptomyces sp. NBC_01268]
MADKEATATALDFHRGTHADAAMLADWQMLPTDQWPDEWFTYNEKVYPRLDGTPLPVPGSPPSAAGADWLERRTSTRTPLDEMTLADLAHVLWYTTHSRPADQDGPLDWHRPYPSAGGRLGCEFYVIAQNVSGLTSGVYNYQVRQHELVRLRAGLTPKVLRFLFGDGWTARTCAFVVATVSLDRLETKYGQRGYRYGLVEAGAAAQTLCLVAASASLGTCVIGGFADVPMGQLLLCTPNSELPVLAVAFGDIEEGRADARD